MKFKLSALILVLNCISVFSANAQTNLVWHDLRTLEIEGKGWQDTKHFYDRFPARAEKMVRPAVWNLSRDSAGMCARFVTDAKRISARWTLRKEQIAMPHMPASGVSGLDLYVKEKGKWRWIGGGRPKALTNEISLTGTLLSGQREYLVYLPLYNGVESVQLGVPAGASFSAAPERRNKKPIVFYGTSILQGASASRPGLAYPAIIGRKLDWPVINLGFSGNAKSEPEVADLLAELNPALYLLDPLPNMDAAGVRERIGAMVQKLRSAHPKTPIVLVENLPYTDKFLVESRNERFNTSNEALREVFGKLKKTGVKNLHYISADNLIGLDGEGTVDGTHPNDLGFMRMAEAIEPKLRKLLR